MTAKQKLKLAEANIAYWKSVAADAKKDLKETQRRKAGKPGRRAMAKKAQRKARKVTRRARR
jgi:hypothetical protein